MSVEELPQPRRFWREPRVQIAFAYFAVLTVFGLFVTRPLGWHFGEAIPFGTTARDVFPEHMRPGDSTQLYYWMWLFKENLEAFRSPLFSPYEYGPLNPDHVHVMALWGFPLQVPFTLFAWVFGGTVAFNLLVLLSFPLTGLAQAWLCRLLGTSRAAAGLGGLMYAFALSRRVQMFGGHANGWLYLHLPIIFACLFLAVKKRSLGWAALTGVSIVSIAFGEWHCFYYTALFLPFYFLFLLAHCGAARLLRDKKFWAVVALLAAFSASSVGYAFWLNSSVISESRAQDNRSRKRVERSSPNFGYLVAAERYRTRDIWGGGDMEPSVYLGNASLVGSALVVLFAGLAFLGARRRRRGFPPPPAPASATTAPRGPPTTRVLYFFLFLFVLGLWLSMGMRPELPGLYEFLYDHLPFWNLSRTPPRLIYIAHAALAVFVPVLLDRFVAAWSTRRPRLARWVLPLFITAVFVDLVALAPRTLLSKQHDVQSEVYDLVRAMPPDQLGPILFFPIYSADYSQNAAFQGITTELERPFINGYAPTAPVAAYKFLDDIRPLNKGQLSAHMHCEMWRLGIRHIVHDNWVKFLRSAKPSRDALERLVQEGKLEVVKKDKVARLYRVVEPAGCTP